MFLKWLINSLIFMWFFEAIIKPFIRRLMHSKQNQSNSYTPSEPPPEPSDKTVVKQRKYDGKEDDYIDYEEIK